MPGRLRTASRPSSTVIDDAPYSLFFFATGLLRVTVPSVVLRVAADAASSIQSGDGDRNPPVRALGTSTAKAPFILAVWTGAVALLWPLVCPWRAHPARLISAGRQAPSCGPDGRFRLAADPVAAEGGARPPGAQQAGDEPPHPVRTEGSRIQPASSAAHAGLSTTAGALECGSHRPGASSPALRGSALVFSAGSSPGAPDRGVSTGLCSKRGLGCDACCTRRGVSTGLCSNAGSSTMPAVPNGACPRACAANAGWGATPAAPDRDVEGLFSKMRAGVRRLLHPTGASRTTKLGVRGAGTGNRRRDPSGGSAGASDGSRRIHPHSCGCPQLISRPWRRCDSGAILR